MHKRAELTFVILFLGIIYLVPVVQGTIETGKSGSVQALDIAKDALITPYRNAAAIHDLFVKVQNKEDALCAEVAAGKTKAPGQSWDPYPAQQIVDEAMVGLADLRKTMLTINRHIRADSTKPAIRRVDSLASCLDALLAQLRSGADIDSVAAQAQSLSAFTKSIAGRYPRPKAIDAPLLAVKNLMNIFWNDSYIRLYEKEMENSSVFALTVRPQMHVLRYILFQDLGEKGLEGRNGWFFYKPDVDYTVRPYVNDIGAVIRDYNGRRSDDDPVAAVLKFKQQLDSLGIELLVVIIPGKPSIYPDMLTAAASPDAAGTFSPSLQTLKDLHGAGVATVDLFAPFAQERGRDAVMGDSLYLHKDTHWRARGLRLAAKTVADRIKQYPWFVPGTAEYALDSVTVERVGDVGVMTTLPSIKLHDLDLAFASEKTPCYQVYSVERDATGAETGRNLYKDDFRSSGILLIGDSFSRIYQTDEPRGAGLIAHIASELKQPIASIVSDGGASTLVRQTLSRNTKALKNKKLVVWEFVERDIRFGAEGWKDVPLVMENKNKHENN
ncbi:MAG: hypothetical protein PHC61_03255 [Chitinivibrionales bacterium]|nr:hypothetical protein [Chitinivibrionales bacterium]